MYKLVILVEAQENWDHFEEHWPEFLHLVETLPGLSREATSRVRTVAVKGRWRRRWRGVLPLAALLVGAVAVADEPAARDLPPPSAVRDLHYGDVLFRFFQ